MAAAIKILPESLEGSKSRKSFSFFVAGKSFPRRNFDEISSQDINVFLCRILR